MKHIHRFFVSRKLAKDDTVCLDPGDSFHAGRVLRLRPGDAAELADSAGRVYAAEVLSVDDKVELRAGGLIGTAPSRPELTVAQALPQGRKLDEVVEKLAELGVERLVPLFTEKSVARDRGRAEKLERWRRIARSAASQSKSAAVMAVEEPRGLAAWLDGLPGRYGCDESRLLVLATEVAGDPLGQLLRARPWKGSRTGCVALVIGPEAGFSDTEIEALREAGAEFAGLGSQVLRTETAAVVAAALALHRLGELG